MRNLEGGGSKSANTGNSLATYPTTSTVLKTIFGGDSDDEFKPEQLRNSNRIVYLKVKYIATARCVWLTNWCPITESAFFE